MKMRVGNRVVEPKFQNNRRQLILQRHTVSCKEAFILIISFVESGRREGGKMILVHRVQCPLPPGFGAIPMLSSLPSLRKNSDKNKKF